MKIPGSQYIKPLLDYDEDIKDIIIKHPEKIYDLDGLPTKPDIRIYKSNPEIVNDIENIYLIVWHECQDTNYLLDIYNHYVKDIYDKVTKVLIIEELPDNMDKNMFKDMYAYHQKDNRIYHILKLNVTSIDNQLYHFNKVLYNMLDSLIHNPIFVFSDLSVEILTNILKYLDRYVNFNSFKKVTKISNSWQDNRLVYCGIAYHSLFKSFKNEAIGITSFILKELYDRIENEINPKSYEYVSWRVANSASSYHKLFTMMYKSQTDDIKDKTYNPDIAFKVKNKLHIRYKYMMASVFCLLYTANEDTIQKLNNDDNMISKLLNRLIMIPDDELKDMIMDLDHRNYNHLRFLKEAGALDEAINNLKIN